MSLWTISNENDQPSSRRESYQSLQVDVDYIGKDYNDSDGNPSEGGRGGDIGNNENDRQRHQQQSQTQHLRSSTRVVSFADSRTIMTSGTTSGTTTKNSKHSKEGAVSLSLPSSTRNSPPDQLNYSFETPSRRESPPPTHDPPSAMRPECDFFKVDFSNLSAIVERSLGEGVKDSFSRTCKILMKRTESGSPVFERSLKERVESMLSKYSSTSLHQDDYVTHHHHALSHHSSSPKVITQQLQRLITDPTLVDGRGGKVGHSGGSGPCEFILTVISVLVIIASLPFSLFFCIKVVQEYERAVIFRLGCLLKGGARGPGIFFIIPCIETYCKVDLRTVTFDVPPQEIQSKDSVTVSVDAVVYYRISNATIAVTNVEDYNRSTRLLAATTLRNVLGTKNLTEILSERESISRIMRVSLDDATDPWGVHVERVEVKDVRLPVQMQRAMAAEAEAARDARAKVIMAQGVLKTSKFLKDAADTLTGSNAAMQLRYLQALNSIAAENNSTIIFPVPMTLFDTFSRSFSSSTSNDAPPPTIVQPPTSPISPFSPVSPFVLETIGSSSMTAESLSTQGGESTKTFYQRQEST